MTKSKILFLSSDTGGGHRSAAEAIMKALEHSYGAKIKTEMVDILKDHAPVPFDRVPNMHAQLIKTPNVWGVGYKLSDSFTSTKLLNATLRPYVRKAVDELIASHPSDLIVSLHPFGNTPILDSLASKKVPFITIVTDLVTTHAFWYDKRVDLCILPTENARQKALEGKLRPDQIKVIGLPVDEAFSQHPKATPQLRRDLGWPTDRPVVLMMAGGNGVGAFKPVIKAIAKANLDVTFVAVTGKNAKMKSELEQTEWPFPFFCYGFVSNVADFMQAADILVTKAGPGTISEAFCSGLPLILFDRIPGQEEGNVGYVVQNGAGVWAPTKPAVVEAIKHWIHNPPQRAQAAAASKRLARPQAAADIAHILARYAKVETAIEAQ